MHHLRIKQYNFLLSLSYDEAVNRLLEKYGPSKDDYYRERSYERFLNKEIKSISRGKYTRILEGLYCHHIAEDKYSNLSNSAYIFTYKYPFSLQKKEQLVYCDVFEHLILHALIAKETDGKYGIPGYSAYLYPMIIEWYIFEMAPLEKDWQYYCYKRAFLDPEEVRELLSQVNLLLPPNIQARIPNPRDITYITPEEIQKKNLENQMRREKEDKQMREEQVLREKQLLEERIKEFYRHFPYFEEMNIRYDTPRSKVLSMLYDLKYHTIYTSKKELDSAMKPYIKDQLLEDLYLAVSTKD